LTGNAGGLAQCAAHRATQGAARKVRPGHGLGGFNGGGDAGDGGHGVPGVSLGGVCCGADVTGALAVKHSAVRVHPMVDIADKVLDVLCRQNVDIAVPRASQGFFSKGSG
jgi:hypothetical protein